MTSSAFQKSFKRFASLKEVAVVSLALVSCAHPVLPMGPPPVASELLQKMNGFWVPLKSMRAESKAELRRGDRTFRFKLSLLAKSPNQMFAESSGFGFPSAQTAVTAKAVQIYMPGSNELYEGSVGLEGVLGVPLLAEEWIPLLLGEIPAPRGEVVSITPDDRSWKLEVSSPEGKQFYRVDSTLGWLRSYEETGVHPKLVEFGSPKKNSWGDFPSSLSVRAPQGSLSLTFSKITPNPGLSDEDLRLDVPPSASVHPLIPGEVLVLP